MDDNATERKVFGQRPDMRSFDKAIIQHRNKPFGREIGSYVETEHGWGRVENITSHGAIIVSLFKWRDNPGRQYFPEWAYMRQAERHGMKVTLGKQRP